MSLEKILSIIRDDHAKYFRRKNTDGFRYKYSLSHPERKKLVRESGVQALVLFEYYLRLASTENTIITDEDAADYFGWETRTAAKWRRVLVKDGWLSAISTRQHNGHTMYTYYLGEEEVRASKPKPVTSQPEATGIMTIK